MKNISYKFLMIAATTIIVLIISSACSSSKKDSVSNKSFSADALPLGSINIYGEVVSAEEHDKLFEAAVKVKKVVEYGGNAPLVNENSNLKIRIKKSLLKNSETNDGKIKPGETYDLIIKYYETLGNTNDYWETLEIKNYEADNEI